jgi:hypothetical protein
VKLIEMRSVASIESILERLDALSAGKPLSTHAASASAEKKTLKSEPEAPARADVLSEPVAAKREDPQTSADELASIPEIEVARSLTDAPPIEPELEPSPFIDERIDSPPPRAEQSASTLRLPRLSSAELEHFDEPRFDDGYEEKLRISGDDLLPLKTAEKLMESLFGILPVYEPSPSQRAAANGSAAAPAYDVSKIRADVVPPKEEDVELPVLSADPTEEELMAYANAHPSIRAAKRIFRAKIVRVTKA